ncbi:hypothetical protein GCM10022267_54800 [Lentzea roselyniae]|uniref:Uncharacterized protein n=1 Tax=Lentzea roselyniae TaxID=531940 RepID=A0ABP7BL35_9PSEU
MHEVVLPLSEPPVVADIGVGVHGVTTLEDVFLLPDLWQLHLYGYEGAVEVGDVVHRIAPGRASLIPPAPRCATGTAAGPNTSTPTCASTAPPNAVPRR